MSTRIRKLGRAPLFEQEKTSSKKGRKTAPDLPMGKVTQDRWDGDAKKKRKEPSLKRGSALVEGGTPPEPQGQ